MYWKLRSVWLEAILNEEAVEEAIAALHCIAIDDLESRIKGVVIVAVRGTEPKSSGFSLGSPGSGRAKIT